MAGLGIGLEILQMVFKQGTETDGIYYKTMLDLGQTRNRVELAKDVAAFKAADGHIVIGAGRPATARR